MASKRGPIQDLMNGLEEIVVNAKSKEITIVRNGERYIIAGSYELLEIGKSGGKIVALYFSVADGKPIHNVKEFKDVHHAYQDSSVMVVRMIKHEERKEQ